MSTLPPPPAPAYIYSPRFAGFDYGPGHPLRMERLALTQRLICLLGLDQASPPFEPATREELEIFHDRRYLDTLMELSAGSSAPDYFAFGLGAGDNPVFPRLYELAALATGATLAAVRAVSQQGHQAAFSMSGGMHHALAGRASGFCYINDPVVAIKGLLGRGKRVLYLDIDAHHGDGVQWAFYDSDQVLTLSLHQHGATLFPGTGSLQESGKGVGRGFSVNLPLWPDSDDDIFMAALDRLLPPLLEAFAPDYVVSQLGVDTFLQDPLASLNLTTRGFGHAIELLRELAWGRWIALGGGGYHLLNVARAWTYAWAIISGRQDQVPDELPRELAEELRLPADERRLLDPEMKLRGRFWDRAKRDALDALEHIEREIFPIVGARKVMRRAAR